MTDVKGYTGSQQAESAGDYIDDVDCYADCVAVVVGEYTEFIKPGASMESRHFRTRQKNI